MELPNRTDKLPHSPPLSKKGLTNRIFLTLIILLSSISSNPLMWLIAIIYAIFRGIKLGQHGLNCPVCWSAFFRAVIPIIFIAGNLPPPLYFLAIAYVWLDAVTVLFNKEDQEPTRLHQ